MTFDDLETSVLNVIQFADGLAFALPEVLNPLVKIPVGKRLSSRFGVVPLCKEPENETLKLLEIGLVGEFV